MTITELIIYLLVGLFIAFIFGVIITIMIIVYQRIETKYFIAKKIPDNLKKEVEHERTRKQKTRESFSRKYREESNASVISDNAGTESIQDSGTNSESNVVQSMDDGTDREDEGSDKPNRFNPIK